MATEAPAENPVDGQGAGMTTDGTNSDTGAADGGLGVPNSDLGSNTNDAGAPNGNTSVQDGDAGAPDSSPGAPNSDGGAPNSENGAPNTNQGVAADKGGDKIENLNNVAVDPSGPGNTTNTDTGTSADVNGPKGIPEKDPSVGGNITESQNVPAVNQSLVTKLPEVLPDVTTAGKDVVKPIQDVTVGELVTTAETTASTTRPTTTETTTPQQTTESTTKATTEPIIIEFPNSAKTDPPYAIITSPSPTNETLIGPGDPGKSSKGAVVIATSVIGVLLVVIAVAVAIIWLLQRKKRRSKQIIQTVENPRYNAAPTITRSSPPSAPHQYRFSRDADISIGEVRTGKTTNNNLKASPRFGKKGMLSYSPSVSGSDISGTGSRRIKKKAPPPPNPFGNPEYYERDESASLKDSNGSDGYEMTTFGNVSTFGKGATPSPKPKAADDAAKEPLLNGKAGSKEPKRSGDYSSSSSSSSEDEDGDKSDIQKAVDDKFQEHRNSHNYSALGDEEEAFETYDQKLNPFSDSFADTEEK